MEFVPEKVYCEKCNGLRNHKIIYKFPDPNNNLDQGIFIDHSILQCAGCDSVTYGDISSVWIEHNGERPHLYVNIYPDPPAVEKPITIDPFESILLHIPINIRSIYLQLVAAYNQKHNLLCAIGLRTLIEAICNELGIIKGFKHDNDGNPLVQEGKRESIEGKIYGLYENKHIIWYETLILQRIREIGNAAAHEAVIPTSEELHGAIEIIERLLVNLYQLKNHKLLKKEKQNNRN
ncbi:DUF4145 domain-containing protein [Fictibacillus sp. S7]|uniref:DUF4145 domain-containing protein n=1 Tax=Fictibacillus sp. S7 TaxID=2212476 RepID=UPI0013E97038|nr:DUF4145 domain-containing protein [Fictibacillus sp. S7]